MLSSKIKDIQAIFGRNVNRPKQKLELEAKYGYYSGRRFNSDVPYIHYERLLNQLRIIGSETTEESTVAQLDNIRRITITSPGDAHETVIWQRKIKIQD